MKRALAIGIGGVLVIMLWAGAARTGPQHVSVGVFVAADASDLTLLEHGRRITLVVGPPTVITDEAGRTLRADDLQPGDPVREECLPLGLGRFMARRITVLRHGTDTPGRSAAAPPAPHA